MRTYLAALTLLVALSSDVWAYWNFDSCAMSTTIDPNNPVQGMAGNPNYFVCTKDNKCKAYVVLVTFTNKKTGWYKDDDQPYGYSWDLFNQFFDGNYESVPAYTGNIVRQATGKVAETEAVFGSVRAYFDEVYGGDIIEFELLNRKNTDGSPMWLELPKTKYDYANLPDGDLTFWNDAEAAVRDDDANRDVLNPVPSATDPSPFPFKTAPASTAATLLANKAIYVYAGLALTNYSPLHPRVDVTTRSATNTGGIGARMVMGERQGWGWGLAVGNPDRPPTKKELMAIDDTVDRFAGIGLHVHEWGHLFGFNHPDGQWTGNNPHPSPPQTGVSFGPANLLLRGSMQDGAHGPVIAGQNSDGTPSNYRLAYRSCPNPYNPFYRMDLDWNTTETISASMNKKIRPGPAHIYVIPSTNGQDYLLDFRDVNTGEFGQYAGYKKLSSSGLLIWRRETGTNNSNPMLIPADGRSIDDARFPVGGRDPQDIMFDDLLSDPFGAAAQPHGPTVTEATAILHDHFTSNNRRPRTPSHLAFRDIKIGSDSEGAFAEVDIRFIPLPPTSLSITAAPTEADPNAVTLSWNAPDPNGTDPILGYQYSTDGGTTWHPSLEANPLVLITSSPATITGLAATDLTFQMRTVTDHPNSAKGIGPDIDNLSPASDTIVLDRPGRVALTAVEPTSHTPPSVGDELTATVSDANVSAWADANISWRWQRSADGRTWNSAGTSTPLNSTNTATYELRDADVGQQVRVIAEYSDGVFRDPDTATSDPVTVNSRPAITTTDAEATAPSADENSTDVVYTYAADDPDAGNTIRWSLGGTNATLFTINSDGELTFAAGAEHMGRLEGVMEQINARLFPPGAFSVPCNLRIPRR